jgi:ribosomal-protein-serine acetyltransferase
MEPLIDHDLCIRPFAEGDVAAFVEAVHESVKTVGVWMPWCVATYSEADARLWFAQCLANLRANTAYDLGIFSSTGAELYGGISINQINVNHKMGNIGYWVRQSHQGKGIATRAVRCIAGYGFSQLKLTRLEIVAAEKNLPSRAVAQKVGAVLECIAPNRLVVKQRAIAAAVYSMLP